MDGMKTATSACVTVNPHHVEVISQQGMQASSTVMTDPDLCVILYRVCISEQAALPLFVFDHEAAAGCAELPLALPW